MAEWLAIFVAPVAIYGAGQALGVMMIRLDVWAERRRARRIPQPEHALCCSAQNGAKLPAPPPRRR